MAQSSRVTAANVAAVESLLTGSGTNQPAGVITAGKPKAVEPPKIDKPRKRKVTLE